MSKKYTLALILNTIPFFLSCLLYDSGIVILMIISILQIIIIMLNYNWTNKIVSYLFLNLLMIISSVISTEIITRLYYNNISSDYDTLAVGSLAEWFFVILIILITLLSFPFKISSIKLNKEGQS